MHLHDKLTTIKAQIRIYLIDFTFSIGMPITITITIAIAAQFQAAWTDNRRRATFDWQSQSKLNLAESISILVEAASEIEKKN